MATKKISKKKAKKETKKFTDALGNYLQNIEGLQKCLYLSMITAFETHEKETKKIDAYIEKYGEFKTVKGEKFFRFHFTHQSGYETLVRNIETSEVALTMLPRSLFVSMVSQLDLLVAEMMRSVLEKYPEIIPKEKNLTYEELIKFQSVEEAKTYFIEDEIDGVLRGDHAGHINWFEKKLGIKLKEQLGDTWNKFIELTERRNLFVHTDGKVSSQYLNCCKKHSIIIEEDIKKDSILHVGPDYFTSSYKCLYEIAVKLSWCVFRKIYPEGIEDIDSYYSNLAIGLVKEKDSLSENFFTFFLHNSDKTRELEKNLFTINLALSKKVSGKFEEAIRVLDTKDWSASSAEFILAKAVIKEDYDEAYKYMEIIGSKSALVSKSSYSDPIYDDFRNTPQFNKLYKKIFKEEYISNKSQKSKKE